MTEDDIYHLYRSLVSLYETTLTEELLYCKAKLKNK